MVDKVLAIGRVARSPRHLISRSPDHQIKR
jgi:hypothetical protein